MLGLAGLPGTVGFVGKFQLIHALVDGDYTWAAVMLVIGAMISLGYYLRVVVAAVWMSAPSAATAAAPLAVTFRPIAGGSPQADELGDGDAGPAVGAGAPPALAFRAAAVSSAPHHPELLVAAVLCASASIFFSVIPSPLFQFAAHASAALTGLF